MPTGIYKRKPFSEEHKKNMSKSQIGNTNGFQKGHIRNKGNQFALGNRLKGDNIGNKGMHHWVKINKGKASEHKCVDCGKQAAQWSNENNHIYRRVLDDYSARCVKCHKQYDKNLI